MDSWLICGTTRILQVEHKTKSSPVKNIECMLYWTKHDEAGVVTYRYN